MKFELNYAGGHTGNKENFCFYVLAVFLLRGYLHGVSYITI